MTERFVLEVTLLLQDDGAGLGAGAGVGGGALLFVDNITDIQLERVCTDTLLPGNTHLLVLL